ncbi:hypothetical protein ACI2L4_01130 [Streptomyces sparsogenes]|uniref:hypothetical protein n=1 Tax=Streptomyces sparsogenes TaxID=67365 RepID=UPI0033DFC99A
MPIRSRVVWPFGILLAVAVLLAALTPPASAAEGDRLKVPAACKVKADGKPAKTFNKKSCYDFWFKNCTDKVPKENEKVCDEVTLAVWNLIIAPDRKCKGNAVAKKFCEVQEGLTDITDDGQKFIKDPAKTIATAAFDAVAGNFAIAASEILSGLTDMFLNFSTIRLEKTGINGPYDPGDPDGSDRPDEKGPYQLTWALSALVALLLLIWQFTKVGISGDGSSAATAIIGLAKWAVICVAALAVTQAALGASDEVSRWMIEEYNEDIGKGAFQEKMETLFRIGGWKNTALIMIFGILAALASVVLWGEMLLRQAAIVVLVCCIPISAAGGIMDSTKEWWPKARNALISLILIKPVVVLIFVIGFATTGRSTEPKDVMVGLLTIVLGAFAWPALAKFMTFTSVGSGGGLASGLLGAVGGTAGSMFGYGGGTPSGAGAVGGGRAFTQALQSENDSNVAQAAAGGRGGRFGGLGKLGAAGLALQGAKAGKELLEGGMEAMAAHADLGPGKDMGGQVNVPPGAGGDGGGASAPASTPPPPEPGAGGPPPPRVALERGSARHVAEAGDNPPEVEGGREPTPISAAPVRLALPPAPRAVDGSEG